MRQGKLAALLALFTMLADSRTASAQFADAAAIRTAGVELAARSRRLAEQAGPDYQPSVLAAIHRACAARQVTRLDEIAPSEVKTDAKPEAQAPLLALDFRAQRAAAG